MEYPWSEIQSAAPGTEPGVPENPAEEEVRDILKVFDGFQKYIINFQK